MSSKHGAAAAAGQEGQVLAVLTVAVGPLDKALEEAEGAPGEVERGQDVDKTIVLMKEGLTIFQKFSEK